MASVSIVLETPLLTVGEFRCPPADTAWSALNLIGDRPQVVFPRLPVLIEHERGTPLVTAPTHTVLYNANQHYRRELRNPRGDDCVFVELSEASLEQLAEAGATLVDRTNRLVATHAPVDRKTYFLQHLLVRHLRSAEPDPLLAEEAAARVVLDALRLSPPNTRSGARRALAEAVEDELAAEGGSTPLHELARRLHTSAFHLARVFRSGLLEPQPLQRAVPKRVRRAAVTGPGRAPDPRAARGRGTRLERRVVVALKRMQHLLHALVPHSASFVDARCSS